jgi:hypothetical protein
MSARGGGGGIQANTFEDHLENGFISSNNQLKSHKNSNSNES